jgi:phosphoribosylformylglycinamidine synthase
MKARVYVRFKPEVLDPQGQAIQRACGALGFEEVREVRQGKLFELTLDASDPTRAEAMLRELCEKLLANPVIENYRIESLEP